MQAYVPMMQDALGMFIFLGAELSVLFLLISACVSLVQQYVPDSKVQNLLGASKGRGYLLAAGLGAITPFCTCSTIPMLRGLLRARAGFGPTLTFLFASPLLNPIIVALFVATFGWQVTLIYTAFALVISVLAGMALKIMGYERYVLEEGLQGSSVASCCTSPKEEKSSCCAPAKEEAASCCAPKVESAGSCCDTKPQDQVQGQSFSTRVRHAFQDAYGQFKQVLPYLLLGVSLGSIIYGFVPADFIVTYASGESLWAVPVAAVIGIPLYVRVEALIPLSAVLVGKGMGLGAVMALIIGGGGASLTEVILLKSLFRWPVIVAFLVVVLFMAVACGYFFQYVL